MTTGPQDATEHTTAANAARDLGFDPADFERAERGLIAQHPSLALSNRTLHARPRLDPDAPVTLRLARSALHRLLGAATLAELIATGDVEADGDPTAADAIFDHLDAFLSNFPLVEP